MPRRFLGVLLASVTLSPAIVAPQGAEATHPPTNTVANSWELLAERLDGLVRQKTVPIHRGALPGGTSGFDPAPSVSLEVVGRHVGGAGASRWDVELTSGGAQQVLSTVSFSSSDTTFRIASAPFAWPATNKALTHLRISKVDQGADLAGTLDIRKASLRIRQDGLIRSTTARVPVAVKQVAIFDTAWNDVADVVLYDHSTADLDPQPTVSLRTTGVEKTLNPIFQSLHVRLVDASGNPVPGSENVHDALASVTSPPLTLADGRYRLQVRVNAALIPEEGELHSADLVFAQSTADLHGLARTVAFQPLVTAATNIASHGADLDFLTDAPATRAPSVATSFRSTVLRTAGTRPPHYSVDRAVRRPRIPASTP